MDQISEHRQMRKIEVATMSILKFFLGVTHVMRNEIPKSEKNLLSGEI